MPFAVPPCRHKLRDYLPLKQGLRPVLRPPLRYPQTFLRDYLPLKQGLRLPLMRTFIAPLFSQRLSSTKTRIKTVAFISFSFYWLNLRDYLPLKQGLRPSLNVWALAKKYLLRDYLPLKQGLRPPTPTVASLARGISQRLSSTKTRIKTL